MGEEARISQPPEANGGLGAKPSPQSLEAGGVLGQSRRRHGGLGAEPPAPENFASFAKITWLKIMLLKRGLEIGSANMIKLVA